LAFDHHDTVEILAVDAMTVYRGMDIGPPNRRAPNAPR